MIMGYGALGYHDYGIWGLWGVGIMGCGDYGIWGFLNIPDLDFDPNVSKMEV